MKIILKLSGLLAIGLALGSGQLGAFSSSANMTPETQLQAGIMLNNKDFVDAALLRMSKAGLASYKQIIRENLAEAATKATCNNKDIMWMLVSALVRASFTQDGDRIKEIYATLNNLEADPSISKCPTALDIIKKPAELNLPYFNPTELSARLEKSIRDKEIGDVRAVVKIGIIGKDALTNALRSAAKQCSTPEIIQELIDAGANVTAKDDAGKNALDYARDLSCLEADTIVQILETENVGVDNTWTLTPKLQKTGAIVFSRFKEGYTV